jgi:hypothetical protein
VFNLVFAESPCKRNLLWIVLEVGFVEPSFGVGVVCLTADAGVLPKWGVFTKSGAAAEQLHAVLGLGEPSLRWDFATAPA